MRGNELQINFVNAIRDKIPQKTKLAGILADLLSIEKEAVYRRLRGEVPFTFSEVAIISDELGILIDNVVRFNSSRGRPFQLNIVEYEKLAEIDYVILEQYVGLLKSSKNDPHSEIAEVCNSLPISFYAGFESLSRFCLFKWRYQISSKNQPTRYSEVEISGRLKNVYHSFFIQSKQMSHSFQIWDHSIFQYIVNDIRFFSNIYLITPEEVAQIKKDLLSLLDYTESIATNGIYSETGKPVLFYISDINFEAGYSYVKIKDQYISLIRVFILNSVVSVDEITFNKTKEWIQSLKKSSIMISESGEKQRILFFNKQREIINSL